MIKEEENLEQEFMNNLAAKNKKKEKIIFYEFLNFLEVLIHTVIYVKRVYPAEAFYGYSIYGLNYLKFIVDDEVETYISNFIDTLEPLIFSRVIKNIYILIYDKDTEETLELVNLQVEFSQRLFDFRHEELSLLFKSVIARTYSTQMNRKLPAEKNRCFNLCLETKEESLFQSQKVYEETLNSFSNNFIRSLFRKDLSELFNQREVLAECDEPNIKLLLSRNFVN